MAAPPTLLASLLESPSMVAPPVRRVLRLGVEGTLYTACALFIAEAFGFPESGFFAVFLAAAGLTNRFEAILDENRRDIFESRRSSLRANAKSAGSILALFLGAFFAFAAAALWAGEDRLKHSFGFVLEVASIGTDSILTRSFASAPKLFVHNGLVLLAFACLSLVYRTYGALLALMWNACVWGLVITYLVRRGIVESSVRPAIFVSVSALAVLPHLVLEAAAYVLGSLAAIFASRGILKYSIADPVFRRVMIAVALLAATSVGCLVAGAAVEASVPSFVLGLLRR